MGRTTRVVRNKLLSLLNAIERLRENLSEEEWFLRHCRMSGETFCRDSLYAYGEGQRAEARLLHSGRLTKEILENKAALFNEFFLMMLTTGLGFQRIDPAQQLQRMADLSTSFKTLLTGSDNTVASTEHRALLARCLCTYGFTNNVLMKFAAKSHRR